MAGKGDNLGLNVPVGAHSLATVESATAAAKELAKEARSLEKSMNAAIRAGRVVTAQEREFLELTRQRLIVTRQQESAARNAVTTLKQTSATTGTRAATALGAYSRSGTAIGIAGQMITGSGARDFITGLSPAESQVIRMGAGAITSELMTAAGTAASYVGLAYMAVNHAFDVYYREKQNEIDTRKFMADVNAGRRSRREKELFNQYENTFYSKYIDPQGVKFLNAANSLAGTGAELMDQRRLRAALDKAIAKPTIAPAAPQAIDMRDLVDRMNVERREMINTMAAELRETILTTRRKEMRDPSTIENYMGASGEMVSGPHYNEQRATELAYKEFLAKNQDKIAATPAAFAEMLNQAIDYEKVDGRRGGQYRFDPRGTPFTPPAGYRGPLRARMQPDRIVPIFRNADNTPTNVSYQQIQYTSITKPMNDPNAAAVLSDRREYRLRNGHTVARTEDDE